MDEELAFPGTDDGRTVAEVDAYIKAENTAWPAQSGRVLTLADSVADLEGEARPLTDDELADCGLLSELTTDEEPTAPAPVAQPVGVMSRATVVLGSGAGYKEVRMQFAELEDAEQVRLWAASCGAQMGAINPATQVDPLPGMSDINRTIAYSAASKLRDLGFEWDGREWASAPAPVAQPLTDEQIEKTTGAKRGTPLFIVAVGFTRAVERAHGIEATGQEGGAA